MEYNKIIAVTGLPGLYELLSSKSDGAIVRSLDDKTTRFVSSRVHNFSHLESIEVYTVRDNVNLVDILKAMEAGGGKLPDEKDAGALKAYFTKVYPDLDFTRVYSSDLKKMVKWYSVLKANNIEIKLTEPEEGEVVEDVDGLEEEEPATVAKKKPAPGGKAEKAVAEKPVAEKVAAGKPAAKKEAAAGAKKAESPKKASVKEAAKKTDKKAASPAGKTEKAKKTAGADKPKKAAKKK
jgi:hypothetical protein